MTPDNNTILLKKIIKVLDALQVEIHEYTETIRKEHEASRRSEEPQPPQPIKSDVSLPPAVTAYYEAEQGERPANNKWRRIERGIAFLAFVAALTLAAFTYKTLGQVKRQADSAQAQVDTMQRQLEATDRPWVKVEPRIASNLTFNANGEFHLGLAFPLKNVGRSVATNVTVYAAIFVPKWEGAEHFKQPRERQKALCDKVQPHALTLTLFPDETQPFNMGLAISRYEMEANIVPPQLGLTPLPPGRRIAPILFGCADYQFSSLPKHHQTGFTYSIVRREAANPGVPFLIVIGQDLPITKIGLERWIFENGDYAN